VPLSTTRQSSIPAIKKQLTTSTAVEYICDEVKQITLAAKKIFCLCAKDVSTVFT